MSKSKDRSYNESTAPTTRGGRVFATLTSRAEWLAYRSRGIGGSEIGSVLGVNSWKSATQLFFEKLGLFTEGRDNNMRMFMGNYMESHIANLWEYWGGSEEQTVANYNAVKKTRTCVERPETIWLKKHPYLLANIDRQIETTPGKKGRGVLECKTINGFYAQQWAAGVPPAYVYQIQQYLLVTGYKYAEMALLQDGNALRVLEFDAAPLAHEQIIEQGLEFWSRIEAARPYAAQYCAEEEKDNPNRALLADLMGNIERFEPRPESTPAYEEFLRKRFNKPTGGNIIADAMDLRMAKIYMELGQKKKEIEEHRQEVANRLMRRLGDAEVLDMGDAGKVTWKANEKGTRVFRVSIKE